MLRRRTRSRRHAYWFPLALFGLLIAVSAPFYYPQAYGAAGRAHGDVATTWPLGLDLLRPMFGGSRYAALYWLVALVGGFALTAWWYRRSAGRTGLRTSSRGQLITGIVLVVLLVALPATVLAFPGDLVVRGFIPLLIIAAALWALCPAERSPALYAIAAVYTAVALIVNLYNLENITYRLGIDSQSGWATSLPNVLLPALVLLAASGWAYVSQRRRVN